MFFATRFLGELFMSEKEYVDFSLETASSDDFTVSVIGVFSYDGPNDAMNEKIGSLVEEAASEYFSQFNLIQVLQEIEKDSSELEQIVSAKLEDVSGFELVLHTVNALEKEDVTEKYRLNPRLVGKKSKDKVGKFLGKFRRGK